MNAYRTIPMIFLFASVITLAACVSVPVTGSDAPSEPTVQLAEMPTPTVLSTSEVEPLIDENMNDLPERPGPRVMTSGTVPHVQIDVSPVPEVNDELYRLAFSLPDVENRPTVISLPGARGMWIAEGVPLVHPEVIVSGREFAHIHPDGSLHLALPFDRALEVAETGWGERHPWADERENWEGFVMLYTPQSLAELEVTFQLILESYNHVTGREITLADLDL